MSPGHRLQLARLLGELAADIKRGDDIKATGDELRRARLIAADTSRQTGKNREKFLNGTNDHSYGVRCALAGIRSAK